MISVYMEVPEAHRAKAQYAIRELTLRWSIATCFVSDPREAQLHYAPAGCTSAPGSTFVRFDPRLYDETTVCVARSDAEGRRLWGCEARSDPDSEDLIGATYRLLTYLDEAQVAATKRDQRGIFMTAALPSGRREATDIPLVECHAEALLSRVLAKNPSLRGAQIPRWPHGKRYAIALSHDVDALHLGSTLELATNLIKGCLRGSREHLGLFGVGLRYLGRASQNPYFAFSSWREWELEHGTRSATYLYYRPSGVRRDVNDCKSGVGRGTDWNVLKSMAREGWEFGLHPSIHVAEAPEKFREAKLWVEERLGMPIHGLRHHYWALDWLRPYVTHRKHASAGYRYDSSIAWRDQAGFRAGTALPYRPFDPVVGEEIQLVEIPCNLMDGHALFENGLRVDPVTAIERGRALMSRVRECGGVATPNWHLQAAFNHSIYRDFLDVCHGVLEPFLDDSDAWIATPFEVCKRWEQLRTELGIDGSDPAPYKPESLVGIS